MWITFGLLACLVWTDRSAPHYAHGLIFCIQHEPSRSLFSEYIDDVEPSKQIEKSRSSIVYELIRFALLCPSPKDVEGVGGRTISVVWSAYDQRTLLQNLCLPSSGRRWHHQERLPFTNQEVNNTYPSHIGHIAQVHWWANKSMSKYFLTIYC